MNHNKNRFWKIFVATIATTMAFWTFVEDVILTQSAFYPINLILLLSCVFSCLGVFLAFRQKLAWFIIAITLTAVTLLLAKYYIELFLVLPLVY